jgi:predicted acetyltransferase
MVDAEVRTLRGDELVDASRVVNHGMLGSIDPAVLAGWAEVLDPDCSFGAFAGDQLVGLARHFPTELAVPGGEVRAAGITAVGVLPTHRRQGHLRRLMDAQLGALADSGVPVATLVAAEWPIYGRFGYGPAIDACGLEIDARTARFTAPPSGTVELVAPEQLRVDLEAAYEARRARTPGAIRMGADQWDRIAGVRVWPGQSPDLGARRGAVWRDDEGAVQGAVAYKVADAWTNNRPTGTATVVLLVGTVEAERELWRHLCEIDWVTTVSAGNRSIEDPLGLQLEDGRAVVAVDRSDCIWVRLLDLPVAIAARTSTLAGRCVVDVVDDLGFAAGRFALELGPEGSEARPSKESAEVRLPVRALGAAYLGGQSLARLHAAGWLDEEAPGAVARLGALLATPTAPWSPTTY